MTTAAMIGLGRMGGPMADHVAAAGHDLRVFDVAPAAMAARHAAATTCASPADAARGAAVVAIVVFDDAQAIDVVTGRDGVLGALDAGAVIALHTTATLDTIRRLAAATAARGVTLLDAGISGGETGAAAGTLLSLVGGPADAVEAARPVLDAYSKEVVHAGPLGAGMALKLARNATGYSIMAAVHEALALAVRAGIEPAVLRHVLEETGVLDQGMTPFALGGPAPLPADDTARRPAMEHLLRLADKDLDHALALAGELGEVLSVAEATRATFARVALLGP